jgi:hypothetical protein
LTKPLITPVNNHNNSLSNGDLLKQEQTYPKHNCRQYAIRRSCDKITDLFECKICGYLFSEPCTIWLREETRKLLRKNHDKNKY